MSLALYRKYRPATFADLVGQDHVATTLRNQVRRGETVHAYLFAGVRGTGKTSTARILARALTCLDLREGEPCNRCDACLEVLRGSAVDVLEIDAASNRGIDEMRDLRERVKFLPAFLRRKVYVVDEAHMLTTEAWNAFLKTLEEPPAHVVFILCTTEPHKVPETVRSRVQRFDFRRVSTRQIAEHLSRVVGAEGLVADADALELIARAAQGSLRDALSLLDHVVAAPERPLDRRAVRRALGIADPEVVLDVLRGIAAGDGAAALRSTATAFATGADARQLLREASRLARVAQLVALGADDLADTGLEELEAARTLAEAPAGLWVAAMERFATAELNLRQPVDARLQVELAVLALAERAASPAGGEAMGDLLDELRRRVEALEARVRAADLGEPVATVEVRPQPLIAPEPTPVRAKPAPSTGAGFGGRVVPKVASPATASVPAASPAAPGPVARIDTGEVTSGGGLTRGAAATPAEPGAVADAVGPGPGAGSWTERWPAVVEAVNRRDPMLAGVLRSCCPLGGEEGRLVVGAPYGFHLERLKDPHKAVVLAQAAAEVCGEPCTVEAVFCGDRQGEENRSADGVDATRAVLATFPGSRITASRLRDPSAKP